MNKRHSFRLSGLIFAAILFSNTSAWSQESNRLEPSLSIEGRTLKLCGEVTLRALGLFKFGYGGLYLADCNDYTRVTGNVAKQWSVLLTRNAKGSKLSDIADEALEDNFNEQQLAALDSTFSCITDAYRDAAKGSQVDVRYIPGTGLQLLQDQELLADCGGGAGAAEYFRIWFGEKPFNKSLKKRILEQASTRS